MPTKPVHETPLRIGAVSYLNSKPLTEHLAELFPDAVVRDDYPSRLADDLSRGDLDVALIPSIEYFRGENYEIVSDACVAARGPVFSVKLYARVPWGEVKMLGLDEGSRTSVALSKILLGERYGVEPETVPFRLGDDIEACSADAILMIGDRAMHPQDEKFHATWDLGEEWFRWTGLPFVFAMWVARKSRESTVESREPEQARSQGQEARGERREARDAERTGWMASPLASSLLPLDPPAGARISTLDSRLSLARDLGVKSIPEIAERESSLLNLPLATTIRYLTRNLHFHLGPAERNGLRKFYELAARRGLAPEGLKLVFRSGACVG